MKRELADFELGEVVGGCVIISQDHKAVCFTKLNEVYSLVGITPKQYRTFVEDLQEQNPQMGEAAFDKFIKELSLTNGYLAPYQK